MGLDDFSLQSNNGKKYSLKDLKDIKLEDIAKNPKLQKFIKLFDFDGSGAIENRWVNGKNEWQSIFTELKQAAVDDDLSNEEFGLYISKKMPNEDLKLEDVNELLDIASGQGNVTQIGDMTITRMNGFVAIKIKPNTTILAKNVNENGQFSDDDFIEMKTVDSDGKEITVKREEFKTKEGTTQCIVVTRQDSKDESSTTIYGTSSYYMYEIFKGEESLKAMEFYRKGNNEYYVQYSQEGNTITHAKNGDTVESLIQKFGFKDRAEFDRLNPSLKGKKYPIVADSIVVPGHYSAKDSKIVEQGTVYGEQYNYIKTVSEAERRKFKEEHLQKLDEDIFNKLNNLKGLELSNENIGLYFSLNSYPQKTQEYIFNIIAKLAKEGKTPDEIKTYFLSDPNAPKLTRKDGTKVNINLFNEFIVQMHNFVGTQVDDTPQSVKGFIQDVMGLDIIKGEGKELYEKLSKVGDPYVIMDINEMFSNIYHRTTKEYKDWHSKQVARLNSDGWKSDKSIKTTGEREYLKGYPPISKETALEMYRAVINKMTAQKGETVTTKYDKFIEDNRDVYLREFATLTLFSLHQSGAGNLQGTAAQKDILNPSKYLLKPVGSFYDKKGKEIYETMMADCYKVNKKFESILKCYTTGYKQAGVPFDKAKMKHCMDVLQNPKSTEAQKKKALEDAFGYSVVNAAQDLIGVANFVDNVTDMALMIYSTGLIGKGLGKAVSFASKANTATRVTAVITNTAKGISWGERLTQIGLSATNFAIWEGARFTVNYYTNDIEEDFSYGSGLGKRMAGGAAFGTFAGAWGQFVTQPMLKWIFKTPTQEAVTKEATAFVQKQLKGSSKFTSKEVLGAFNAGQQKAMTSLGKEAVGFASELTGFSIYEIGQKLIIGNDSQIRQILQDSKKYKPEEIDDLLKNPEELKKALKEVGCTDDVIRELTEINVGDVALGQLKTLLSFKAVGQLVYMHRAGKLPPSALNFGKEKPLEFEPIKQNGKTMYKVTYPDGTTRTVADMNGVIALSNMHYQDVTLYKPIEQVLAKDGKMELDEGITLFKNAEGYSVTFKDGTKIKAKDLKEVMGKAQTEYTIMGYENELAQKGKVELPDKQVVTFDRENNVYKTTMEGGVEVEAPSFKELLQTVQKKTVCQSIEKTFTDNKKAVMLDEATIIVKQDDGTYRMIVIEDGFPKEYTGKSVEEVLDKSAGVNEGVTTEPQEKVTPQGMNAEEDALIQKARKENPATVIEDKVREKWQQHDLETPTTETDEPAIIFKDGKAVINEDLARRQLEEPAHVVSDEVTSLIFKGKLNEHLTQRYEEMGKVFEEIAEKRSADIKKLVKQNPKNKQAVADGIVKILAQELGMEGFEPPIVFEDTNGADGYADWPNGRIVINKNITNVKKLTSMISHEFVHMLQFRDVLAQYGEQGLRDLIANDKSIPENEKESHIQKALNNPYNQYLLQSYNFQIVEDGTVEDYLRRIYKDEFTNTVGTDNMPKYVDQATEREAYNLGSEKLGENTEGLSDVNAEPSSLQERMARMRAQLQDGQDATVDEVPTQTVSTEGYEIDEYGQIHRKSVPAGRAQSIQIPRIDAMLITNIKNAKFPQIGTASRGKIGDSYKFYAKNHNGEFSKDENHYVVTDKSTGKVIRECILDSDNPQNNLDKFYSYSEDGKSTTSITVGANGKIVSVEHILYDSVTDSTIKIEYNSSEKIKVTSAGKTEELSQAEFSKRFELSLDYYNLIDRTKIDTAKVEPDKLAENVNSKYTNVETTPDADKSKVILTEKDRFTGIYNDGLSHKLDLSKYFQGDGIFKLEFKAQNEKGEVIDKIIEHDWFYNEKENVLEIKEHNTGKLLLRTESADEYLDLFANIQFAHKKGKISEKHLMTYMSETMPVEKLKVILYSLSFYESLQPDVRKELFNLLTSYKTGSRKFMTYDIQKADGTIEKTKTTWGARNHLDKLIDKCIIKEDIVVTRYESNLGFFDSIPLDNNGTSIGDAIRYLEGKTPEEIQKYLADNLYLIHERKDPISTSLNTSTYYFERKKVQLNIKVPKGSKGIYLEDIRDQNKGSYESELLLKMTQAYKITNIQFENGKTIIDIELIPKDIQN